MSTIICGIDSTGQTRFISEVTSGLQQDLNCVHCRARLVAKKGDVLGWHFAHESGQTNHECIVGSREHIRRQLKQHISSTGKIPKPAAYTFLSTYGGDFMKGQVTMAVTELIEWCADDDTSSYIATVKTEDGSRAEIHVRLTGDPPIEMRGKKTAILLIESATAHTNAESVENIANQCKAVWAHIPEASPKIRDLAAVSIKHKHDEKLRQRLASAQIDLTAPGTPPSEITTPLEPHLDGRSKGQDQLQKMHTGTVERIEQPWLYDPQLAFAVELKPLTTIFCFMFSDTSMWFAYQTETGLRKLKPWPTEFDGWDEFFPPTVAKLYEEAQCYVIPDFGIFLDRVRSIQTCISNTSSVYELHDIFAQYAQRAQHSSSDR